MSSAIIPTCEHVCGSWGGNGKNGNRPDAEPETWKQAVGVNLEAAWRGRHRATSLERQRSAQSNADQLTRGARGCGGVGVGGSVGAAAEPRSSIFPSGSDDDESPGAQHKARQQSWSAAFTQLAHQKKKLNLFKCLVHGRTFSKETKSRVCFGMHALRVPFPFPSSARLSCAHLSPGSGGRRTT